MQGGGMGVDGFFTLSGFLITTLLLQEWQQNGSINLKLFYIRRGLRLLPALYLMLAVFSVITLLLLRGEGADATWRGIAYSASYVSNFDTVLSQNYAIGLGLMSHTWSLALEEQFYLVWPLLLVGLLMLRINRAKLAWLVGGLVLLGPVWRFALTQDYRADNLFYVGLYTRFDVLFVGCALGVMTASGRIMPSARAARISGWVCGGAVGLLVLLLLSGDNVFVRSYYYLMFPVIGLCFGAVIWHLLVAPRGRTARMLAWKPLVQVGVVSYGVYLWHNPIFHLFRLGDAGWLDWPVQVVRLGLTAIAVVVSYRYFESPMLKLKERFAGKERRRIANSEFLIADSGVQR